MSSASGATVYENNNNEIGSRQFRCTYCKKLFPVASRLLEHVRIHTGEKPYECYACGNSYSRLSHLKDHLRTHSGEKPYICPTCGKSFTKLSGMREHARIHDAVERHCCPICFRMFSSTWRAKRHAKIHERGSSTTSDKDSLEARIRRRSRKHATSKTIGKAVEVFQDADQNILQPVIYNKKDGCAKKNRSKTTGQEDKAPETLKSRGCCGERSFLDATSNCIKVEPTSSVTDSELSGFDAIDTCDETIKLSSDSASDIGLFVCSDCGRQFSKASRLRDHSKTHSGIRPYACTVCSRRFLKSSGLSDHLRTHTGDRPYLCEYCHRVFAKIGSLREHLRTHTGECPFLCQDCPKKFRTLSLFKYHRKSQHEAVT